MPHELQRNRFHSRHKRFEYRLQNPTERQWPCYRLGSWCPARCSHDRDEIILDTYHHKTRLWRGLCIPVRKREDSNLRYGFPYNSFQDCRFQPLTHASNPFTLAFFPAFFNLLEMAKSQELGYNRYLYVRKKQYNRPKKAH